MSEERILQAIECLGKRLNEKIDTVSQELKEFKEETNTRFDKLDTRVGNLDTKVDNLDTRVDNLDTKVNSIDTRLNKFEDETRENFALMSQMIRQTNERIISVDKKLDQKMEKSYKDTGNLINDLITSVDKHYAKIEKQ